MEENSKAVKCPYCGYRMPLRIVDRKAACSGIQAKCKNKKCSREFLVIIQEGQQIDR